MKITEIDTILWEKKISPDANLTQEATSMFMLSV
jgi:hypothetical protein